MTTRQSQRRSRRPTVEDLESRSLLSAIPFLTNVSHARAAEITAVAGNHQVRSLLNQFPTTPQLTVSTIPANGDLNPYGVAFVPEGFPKKSSLRAGDILVSNFNASSNLQGTGSTIDRITPQGDVSTFYQGAPGLGLTTALGVLKRGFVVVGTLPTTDGTSATVGQGSILLLDRFGHQLVNFTDPSLINGPWDMTIADQGGRASVFVSNVLSGTITRFDLKIPEHGNRVQVTNAVTIASGYLHRFDPAALVIGPTGLAYDSRNDILYVASTGDNEVFAIPHAERSRGDHGMGRLVYQDDTHLHGPLGLVLVPNGHLITANGDALNADPNQPSELVEFTTRGQFVSQLSISPMSAAPFGIAVGASRGVYHLAAVNDDTNELQVYSVAIPRHPED